MAATNVNTRRWLQRSPAFYWHESRRPLVGLVFTLPLLVLYEGGLVLLGPQAIRNGADAWLRQLLDYVGLTGYFLLPVLTIGALAAWHHMTQQPWKLRFGVLCGMFVESALLGLVLLVLAHAQSAVVAGLLPVGASSVGASSVGASSVGASSVGAGLTGTVASMGTGAIDLVGRLVGFFGAGIYEEVLFRLMLLPLVSETIGLICRSTKIRFGGAIILTSVLFSAAHYVGAQGEPFLWFTFAFRFLAGSFFALLFVYRGFGIAAGAHALYDVFAGAF